MEDETNEGPPAFLDGDAAGFSDASDREGRQRTLTVWHDFDASSGPRRCTDGGPLTASFGLMGEVI